MSEIIIEVRKDHAPRIRVLEDTVMPVEDVAKVKEIVEAFGNWRFLLKFFTILGGVISFFVTAVYFIVKTVKML